MSGPRSVLRLRNNPIAKNFSPQIDTNGSDASVQFSLVLGGPIFQLFRKSHLAGDGLELLYRRLIVITLLAWLPLLLFATISVLSGESSGLSFFRDVEVHVRFLVALPTLVAAELIVHSYIRPVVQRFIDRRIVLPEDLPHFHTAIESANRLRNSVPVECGLLFLVYTLGLWGWNDRFSIQTATWFAFPGGRWHLTSAGFWYVFVSIPLFQFILLRWYLRLVIWFRLLWRISRLNLHLVPTHPDRAAGLGFLGKSAYAFTPILFAQGAMLAGLIWSRILYRGDNLQSFKLQIVGLITLILLVMLGPLLMFTPSLARAKRKGLADYGLLAQHYVDSFERRWVLGLPAFPKGLLGAADIQSLADLGNSYSLVRDMRWTPFGLDDVIRLAATAAAPFLPLLFTVFSLEDLFLRVIKLVF